MLKKHPSFFPSLFFFVQNHSKKTLLLFDTLNYRHTHKKKELDSFTRNVLKNENVEKDEAGGTALRRLLRAAARVERRRRRRNNNNNNNNNNARAFDDDDGLSF